MIEHGINILLVEDDDDDALILKRFLTRHPDAGRIKTHHRVDRLDLAFQAISAARPDLVFLDLSLPDSSGQETFLKLYQAHPDIPIIVLSGLNNSDVARELIRHGAQDYLVKGEINSDQIMRSMVYALKRHELDGQLKESEQRYREVLDSISECVWSVDVLAHEQYRYRYCSPAAVKVFGRAPEFFEAWSPDWISLVYPDDRDRLRIILSDALKGKCKHIVHEYRIILPDDRIRWVRQSIEVKLVDGGWVSLSGVASDITERKQLDEIKDQFAGVVSHEIRTPLAIISGAIENLSDGLEGSVNSSQKQLLSVAQKNVKRLQKIISDMLDLTRLESGKIHYVHQDIDFAALLTEFAEGAEKLTCQNRSIKLKMHVAADTPHVWADPDCIMNVLNNLVSNAIRFAKSEISVSVRPSRNSVLLSVRDDGEGIALEEQGFLFDKFVQLRRRADKTGYRGTGLGLAITKELVQAMNGRIWLESGEGEGTVFAVLLPAYVEQCDFMDRFQNEINEYAPMHPNFAVLELTCLPGQKIRRPDVCFRALKKILHKNILNEQDRIYQYSAGHAVYILADGEKSVVKTMVQRIQATVEAALKIRLKVRMAQYPDLTRDATELLEILKKQAEFEFVDVPARKKILFIDDEGDLVHVLVSRFVRKGFMVDVALNGEMGLKKAGEFCPDAIFLDVFMDQMDGWEVCRRLRKMPHLQKTPIIMVTAHQGDGFEAKARETGANCLLHKPTSSKHLIEVVNKYLQ